MQFPNFPYKNCHNLVIKVQIRTVKGEHGPQDVYQQYGVYFRTTRSWEGARHTSRVKYQCSTVSTSCRLAMQRRRHVTN